MSETAKHRDQVFEYCQGNGVDLGSSGDAVVPWAIQVDLPGDEYRRYNPNRPEEAIHWRGDALHLPFQDRVLDFVHCLTRGTLVRSRRGMLPVEAIQIGDKVHGFSGWKTITSIKAEPHSGPVTTIKCHRLPWPLSVTGNHRIMLWKDGKMEFVNADAVKVGDWVVSPFESEIEDREFIRVRDFLPSNNPQYQTVLDMAASGLKFDRISETTGIPRSTVWQWMTNRRTPADCFVEQNGWISGTIKTVSVKAIIPVNQQLMRLVGYYVSDGCASNSLWQVCFYFGKNEQAFRDDVIALVEELFGVTPNKQSYGEKKNIFHVRYCSKIMWHVFRALGGVPNGKRIADWIMRLPKIKQESLLGGLIAGDGCVSKDATAAKYTSANPSLAMQVRELMLRCGMVCSLHQSSTDSMLDGRRIRAIAYHVAVSGENAERLGRLSGKLRGLPKFRLPRYKTTGKIEAPGIYALCVKSVSTEDYHDHVFDLTVDAQSEEGKTFSANGLLVHNSSHLLEDFEDWGPILREWDRVLKIGGYMIIAVPDHGRFRAAVHRGQGDNLNHKHEGRVGELPKFLHTYETVIDRFVDNNPDEYSILYVGRKKPV